jgi:hypothetical protein
MTQALYAHMNNKRKKNKKKPTHTKKRNKSFNSFNATQKNPEKTSKGIFFPESSTTEKCQIAAFIHSFVH